jgi:hypothetical protein
VKSSTKTPSEQKSPKGAAEKAQQVCDTTHSVWSLPQRHHPSKSRLRVQPEKQKYVTPPTRCEVSYIRHHPSKSRLRVQPDKHNKCAVTYQAWSHLWHLHAYPHQNHLRLQQTRNRHNKLHSTITNEQQAKGSKTAPIKTIAQHIIVYTIHSIYPSQAWPS